MLKWEYRMLCCFSHVGMIHTKFVQTYVDKSVLCNLYIIIGL